MTARSDTATTPFVMPAAAVVTDRDGIVVVVNGLLRDLLGVDGTPGGHARFLSKQPGWQRAWSYIQEGPSAEPRIVALLTPDRAPRLVDVRVGHPAASGARTVLLADVSWLAPIRRRLAAQERVLGAAQAQLRAARDELRQAEAQLTDLVGELEIFQLSARQGPCVDAFERGEPVINGDLSASGGRWPDFSVRATAVGFSSAHSIPLRLRGVNLGALNMLHTDSGPFGASDIAAAQALADVATIAILQHQVVIDAQTLNTQLNTALNSRVVIEQAKGRIAQAMEINMDEAFRRLRSHARARNLHLSEFADRIASGAYDPLTLEPTSGPEPGG